LKRDNEHIDAGLKFASPQRKRCGLIEARRRGQNHLVSISSPQRKRCGLIEARRRVNLTASWTHLRSGNAAASLKRLRFARPRCRNLRSPQRKRCGLIEASAPRR
jgi:hypothetical protein